MKILFDHQIFSWQYAGGISRYFFELIIRLGKTDSSFADNGTLLSNNLYISRATSQPFRVLQDIYIPGKTHLITFINKLYSIYKIRHGLFDIFHPTYYDKYFLRFIKNKPYVITVYDMIHELFPQDFPNDGTSDLKRIVITSANRVIAISESTKKDLIDILKIEPSKIDVIHLASSLNLGAVKEIKLPEKFLLYIGDRGKYKNFSRALKAIKTILATNNDIDLVCVGGGRFTNAEKISIDSYTTRFHWLNLTDSELVYAYKSALCLIFPSMYEGFGLPLVEAMQCGCPVVCSNTSSFPEVCGNAAQYFNPFSEEDIIRKTRLVLDDEHYRNELRKRGYNRSKMFSWDRCAKETLMTYRKVLSDTK